jgi:hypothetical protein
MLVDNCFSLRFLLRFWLVFFVFLMTTSATFPEWNGTLKNLHGGHARQVDLCNNSQHGHHNNQQNLPLETSNRVVECGVGKDFANWLFGRSFV